MEEGTEQGRIGMRQGGGVQSGACEIGSYIVVYVNIVKATCIFSNPYQ